MDGIVGSRRRKVQIHSTELGKRYSSLSHLYIILLFITDWLENILRLGLFFNSSQGYIE
jgi:hypothetical protein